MERKLKIKSERQIYHTLMVWPEIKERLQARCAKENKTMIELLDELSLLNP